MTKKKKSPVLPTKKKGPVQMSQQNCLWLLYFRYLHHNATIDSYIVISSKERIFIDANGTDQ